MDEHFIWVVFGRQDHEIWMAKLDKKGSMTTWSYVIWTKTQNFLKGGAAIFCITSLLKLNERHEDFCYSFFPG